MSKVVYRSKDATGLLRDAEHILQKMTENVSMFANPVPDMATFESTLGAYREAYAEATFRDKRAVVLKGQRGRDLQEAIYRLSHYVYAVANGDPAVVLAAGYRLPQPTTVSVGRTPKAENPRVEHVQVGTGVVRLRVNPWRSARMYRYEYRMKGDTTWTEILHSKSMLELSGLQRVQEYEFRMSYVGTDTTPNFSDVVTAIVV